MNKLENNNARVLSLEEIKKVELDLLTQFHDVCRKQKLRYSLGGGTLLGAVRHGGFIPWDDDIDVMMPRPDYDAFIAYCIGNETPFALFSHEVNDDYYFLDAKLSSKNTIIIDNSLNINDKSIGVHIDVFPIDGLGRTEQEAFFRFIKTSYKREVLNAKTWIKYFKSKTHKIYYEPVRFAFYVISRFCNAKNLITKIEKYNRKISFDRSMYAGCVSGSYRTKEIMRKNVFSDYIDLNFEKKQFKGIKKYDDYLKKHYGDYMQLPPPEKRKTHHTFIAKWKEGDQL